jgi:DNA-binding protein YbaB
MLVGRLETSPAHRRSVERVEMANERLMGDLGNLIDSVQAQMSQLQQVAKQREQLTASASVERGRVTVVVDVQGRITETRFDEDIADLTYLDIGKAVTAAAQKAATEVKLKQDELLGPLLALRARMPKVENFIEGLPDLRSQFPVPPPVSTDPPGVRERETQGLEFDEAVADDQQIDGLDEEMATFRTRMREIGRLQEKRARLTATATAQRRRVTVAVNADGVVIETKFASDIDDLSYDEIALAVTAAASEAAAEVARKGSELMRPVVADRPPTPDLDQIIAGITGLRGEIEGL